MSCNVCVMKYNQSTHKEITCKCGYTCCRECVKNYTLGSIKDIHCMSCKIEWTHDFLYEILDKTFVNKIYKEHREKILFDKEISLIPATMPKFKKLIEIEKLEIEYKKLQVEAESLKYHINDLKYSLNKKTESSKKTFNIKCPAENCKGFVDENMKCAACDKICCNKCREIKETGHVCDENTVETIKCMKKDSKACPSCGIMISKISGCDQMYCSECHTAFSWKTLEIDTGNIHNPHYFEFLKKTKSLDRNPLDVLCGRELDRIFIETFIQNSCKGVLSYRLSNLPVYIIKSHDYLMTTLRECAHIKENDLRNFTNPQNALDSNLDLRIEYIKNNITDKKFMQTISKREKKKIKHRQYGYILSMYITCVTDIFYRIHDLNIKNRNNFRLFSREIFDLKDWCETYYALLVEIDNLRIYTQEQLNKVAKNFNNQPYIIRETLHLDEINEIKTLNSN